MTKAKVYKVKYEIYPSAWKWITECPGIEASRHISWQEAYIVAYAEMSRRTLDRENRLDETADYYGTHSTALEMEIGEWVDSKEPEWPNEEVIDYTPYLKYYTPGSYFWDTTRGREIQDSLDKEGKWPV